MDGTKQTRYIYKYQWNSPFGTWASWVELCKFDLVLFHIFCMELRRSVSTFGFGMFATDLKNISFCETKSDNVLQHSTSCLLMENQFVFIKPQAHKTQNISNTSDCFTFRSIAISLFPSIEVYILSTIRQYVQNIQFSQARRHSII